MAHAAAPVSLPTIEFINNEATLQDLASAVTLLFEPAPPIVAHLYSKRPYASYTALIDETEQGYTPEDAAKKVDATATPSADDEETQKTLKRLNEEYEAKYGFKFVVFVNGRPRSVIIPVMEERIRNSTKEAEMKVAMDDMVAIARDRLKKLNAAAKL
ncbi:hypothetical protein BGZ97_000429 [Linnemannia gamsii]|uniref:Oxo-4-hydroxy-4-carboxy-5-ureidoimidazoline decarboxylase domain-containing protein n=1 Tax=Linnemannia gamsii TaxID=64522 RepID=A0A9P6QZS6_9FUNG|nr:hypothetical protein BGZ97_000429 [Linnemannia gamsii]